MPFIIIKSDTEVFKFVRCSYRFRDEYWLEMTESLLEELESKDLIISENTELSLRFNYDFLCSKFDAIIDEMSNVGFLIFAFTNYDVLCQLYIAQVGGFEINDEEFDRNDLAVERRAYRVILEQFVRQNISSVNDTIIDIQENGHAYLEALERLIYLGVQIFNMGNYISKSRYVPNALKANTDEEGFLLDQKKVYADVYHSITNDMIKHGASVKMPIYFEELTEKLSDCFGIDYSGALGYLAGDDSPKSRYGYYKLELAINHLVDNHGFDKDGLKVFYGGLTLNRENSFPTNMSFFKSQDNQRLLFRPIIEFEMDGELYHKTSPNKISESIVSLMANCIPYGASPHEWLANDVYKRYEDTVKKRNDKVLEDPAFKIIKEQLPASDQSVTSLLTGKDNILIDNQECGEIDILCADVAGKRIIICECKNNRQKSCSG